MVSVWRDIRWLGVIVCALTSGACAFDGLAMADHSSFSHGPSRYGALYYPTELPAEGQGYWIPPVWSDRGLNFGVDELVGMLVHVGRTLELQGGGLVLSVGDLSRPSGGRSPWHRSHQTGRDVDLLFFVRDHKDKPVRSDTMFKHDSEGVQRDAASELETHDFDVAANWQMVAALLDNPIAEVQYIFIQDDLRQLLLEHATKSGATLSIITRAADTLRQPSDSAPHDDHMHVRIFCPKSDLAAGCEDFGQFRWHKRDYKYESRLERLQYDISIPEGTVSAMPWLLR